MVQSLSRVKFDDELDVDQRIDVLDFGEARHDALYELEGPEAVRHVF